MGFHRRVRPPESFHWNARVRMVNASRNTRDSSRLQKNQAFYIIYASYHYKLYLVLILDQSVIKKKNCTNQEAITVDYDALKLQKKMYFYFAYFVCFENKRAYYTTGVPRNFQWERQ